MALFQLILLVLFGVAMSTMFSGFMLARRMGFYLMKQVMTLMGAMMVALGALVVGLFFPPAVPAMYDMLHIILLINFVLVALATLMEFGQVLPILMKTMQGGPIHSSHITNLLISFFLTLGLVLFYEGLAIL
ncbi:MAG: hypothetical protein ACTSPR_03255 [Candidatus Thorarchaeota archaeon]|jgi:hypothetical protein|nr:hypothetical protein [Candidatus Thorarchaeota archaeon]